MCNAPKPSSHAVPDKKHPETHLPGHHGCLLSGAQLTHCYPFEISSAMQPDDDASRAESLFQQARAFEAAGQRHAALDCCQRAIRLNPDHAGAQEMGPLLVAAFAVSDPERFAPSTPGGNAFAEHPALPMISVVICSIDAHKFAAVCANYSKLLAECEYEIIGIHDARSLCEGYTRGFSRARGEIIVFSHDDIEILSTDFAMTLARCLRDHDMVGVAGATRFPEGGLWTTPGPRHIHGQVAQRAPGNKSYAVTVFGVSGPIVSNIQVLDGVFFAVRRKVLEVVHFDAETFDGFHFYDLDFSHRVYLAGFRVAVSNEIVLVHQSMGNFDDEWRKYGHRFLHKFRGTLRTGGSSPCFWADSIIELETPQQLITFFRSMVATSSAPPADAPTSERRIGTPSA